MFSYSGRVKSPEWRWQRRRADLRHFEIFRLGPIIIYTRLPAGGAYYPICTFPASSECLISISDAFSAFCLRVSVILPTCSVYPQQKRAYSALQVYARRLLPSAVPWISEDRLLPVTPNTNSTIEPIEPWGVSLGNELIHFRFLKSLLPVGEKPARFLCKTHFC